MAHDDPFDDTRIRRPTPTPHARPSVQPHDLTGGSPSFTPLPGTVRTAADLFGTSAPHASLRRDSLVSEEPASVEPEDMDEAELERRAEALRRKEAKWKALREDLQRKQGATSATMAETVVDSGPMAVTHQLRAVAQLLPVLTAMVDGLAAREEKSAREIVKAIETHRAPPPDPALDKTLRVLGRFAGREAYHISPTFALAWAAFTAVCATGVVILGVTMWAHMLLQFPPLNDPAPPPRVTPVVVPAPAPIPAPPVGQP